MSMNREQLLDWAARLKSERDAARAQVADLQNAARRVVARIETMALHPSHYAELVDALARTRGAAPPIPQPPPETAERAS